MIGGPQVDASQPLTARLKEDVFPVASVSSSIASLGKTIAKTQGRDKWEALDGILKPSVNHPIFAEHPLLVGQRDKVDTFPPS